MTCIGWKLLDVSYLPLCPVLPFSLDDRDGSSSISVSTVQHQFCISLTRCVQCGSRFPSCSPEPNLSGLVCVLVAATSLPVWANTQTPDLSDVGSSLGVKFTRGAGIDRHIVRRSPGSLRHVVFQACRLCESTHARGLRSRGRFLSLLSALSDFSVVSGRCGCGAPYHTGCSRRFLLLDSLNSFWAHIWCLVCAFAL